MKKFLVVIACLLALFTLNVYADENLPLTTTGTEKISVYLFSKDGCPHCTEAEEFFEKLAADTEYGQYFTLVNYQVYDSSWTPDATNKELMDKVAKKMGDSVDGVPYIVIGDDYSANGFASTMEDEVKSAIKKAYNSDKYVDVVKGFADGTTVEKNYDGFIVAGIFLVVIGGFTAFAIFSRKGN